MKSLFARRKMPRHWPFIIPIALGIGFLALAALTAEPTIRFAWSATRTEGTFVGAIGRNGSFYHPMFRYTANDGSVRTFTAHSGSASHPYADGSKASVLYDPNEPGNARLESFRELWFAPLSVGIPGFLLTLIGVGLLAAFRRREREKAPL